VFRSVELKGTSEVKLTSFADGIDILFTKASCLHLSNLTTQTVASHRLRQPTKLKRIVIRNFVFEPGLVAKDSRVTLPALVEVQGRLHGCEGHFEFSQVRHLQLSRSLIGQNLETLIPLVPSLKELVLLPRSGEVGSVVQTACHLFSEREQVDLLEIAEQEHCKQTETILFSGLLKQDFTKHAKTTKVSIFELQLDLMLHFDQSMGIHMICSPKD